MSTVKADPVCAGIRLRLFSALPLATSELASLSRANRTRSQPFLLLSNKGHVGARGPASWPGGGRFKPGHLWVYVGQEDPNHPRPADRGISLQGSRGTMGAGDVCDQNIKVFYSTLLFNR